MMQIDQLALQDPADVANYFMGSILRYTPCGTPLRLPTPWYTMRPVGQPASYDAYTGYGMLGEHFYARSVCW